MRGGRASLARDAAVAAGLMMAWQVASKTIRDSLFLTIFDAQYLPMMSGAAAMSAVVLALLSAKLLHRFGPFKVVPAGYGFSIVLHAAEWFFLPVAPRLVSVLIYVHVVALGSVLLSGFWAVANESFDALEARQRFGRVAGYGTLGGVFGGLVADRIAALFPHTTFPSLLIFLLLLQIGCGLVLLRFSELEPDKAREDPPPLAKTLAGAPYLLAVAGLVALVNFSGAAIEFLFKMQSQAHVGRSPALTQFFARFWMITSVGSFFAQTLLSRFWLNRFGLGRTVATLPVGVAGASLLALLSPTAVVMALVRGLDQVVRQSLFRSGYELFYAPMPELEKRSAKSVIDIGADRAGDSAGYATMQLILGLPPGAVPYCILAVVAGVSAAAAWLAFRLDQVYTLVIQKNLARNAADLKPVEVEDLAQTMIFKTAPGSATLPLDYGLSDTQLHQLTELRSNDPKRIKEALRDMGMLDPILVPQVIRLLGSDAVCRTVHAALARNTFRIAGQLADALLDETLDYSVRRRIPRLLATCDTHRAWDGLFEGLADGHFELRFRCSRGLEAMLHRHASFRPDPEVIYQIVERELSASAEEWQSRQLGTPGEEEKPSTAADGAVEDRASHALAHVFALLGLVLPRDAVRTAFRALHTDDRRLRALAVEYLGSSLPRQIRDQLCERIDLKPSAVRDSGARQMKKLMEESPSIAARLEEIGQREKGTGAG